MPCDVVVMLDDKGRRSQTDHGRRGLPWRGDPVEVKPHGFYDNHSLMAPPTFAIITITDADLSEVDDLIEPEERRGARIRLRIPQEEMTPDWQPPDIDLEDIYDWEIRKTNRQGLTRVIVFMREGEARRALRVDLSTWPNIDTTGRTSVTLAEFEASITRKRGAVRGRAAREAIREERRAKREMRRDKRQARRLGQDILRNR